jgi:hypothetical protein
MLNAVSWLDNFLELEASSRATPTRARAEGTVIANIADNRREKGR